MFRGGVQLSNVIPRKHQRFEKIVSLSHTIHFVKFALLIALILGFAACSFASTLTVKTLSSGVASTTFSGTMGETSFNLGIYVDDRLAKATEIVSGNLPDGLELDSDHFIRGTATKSGTFPLTLRSTYTFMGNTSTATGSITITVLKNPNIKQPTISESFTDGKPNEPYSSKIYAEDGDYNSYEWDYSGTLPDGLLLSAAKDVYELSGTPTKAGTYTFTVYLWDKYEAENGKAEETFTVKIADSTPPVPKKLTLVDTYDETTMPTEFSLTIGDPFVVFAAKVDNLLADSVEVISGSLPDGLKIDNDEMAGCVYGEVTKSGTFTFTLRATRDSSTATETFTITVKDPSLPSSSLSIKYKFATGYVNSSYEDWIMAVDNNGKCTWTGEGSLPSGLSLQTSGTNNEYVTLKGTPSESGSYEFTLSVKDSGGKTANRSFTVTIASGRNGLIEIDPEKEAYDDTDRTTTNIQRIEVIEKKEENVNHTVSLGGGGCESGFGVISVIALGIMLRRRYQ